MTDTILAPAKLNLHLSVLDKRPDGFHNLESVFLAVDLFDTIHFEPSGKGNKTEISLKWDKNIQPEEIPQEKNIIYKTLSLFREKTGFNREFKVDVEKRIPAGSGLGGGSSDAASTLLMLNELAGSPLKQEQLLKTAASLGSDVPFFICRTAAARVTGRGEFVTPIEAPDWFIVIVNPGFSSGTAAAFKLLDERRNNVQKPKNPIFSMSKLYFRNDFLDILPEKDIYNRIILRLKENDADFAGLSGTGSTCFGIFPEKTQADNAAALMSSEYRYVKNCKLINKENIFISK